MKNIFLSMVLISSVVGQSEQANGNGAEEDPLASKLLVKPTSVPCIGVTGDSSDLSDDWEHLDGEAFENTKNEVEVSGLKTKLASYEKLVCQLMDSLEKLKKLVIEADQKAAQAESELKDPSVIILAAKTIIRPLVLASKKEGQPFDYLKQMGKSLVEGIPVKNIK